MKKKLLLVAVPFVFLSALSAQVTQAQADEIVMERMSQETQVHTIFSKDGVQTEMTITIANGEVFDLDYSCFVYYIRYGEETNNKFLIVNANNGNLLEIRTQSNAEPENLAEWREIEEEPSTPNISGTWKVKALYMSGELTNIGLPPDDALYSEISITIPESTTGYIIGNTFYNMIEFEFEIEEQQQIRFHNISQYVENELIIRLVQGVDAYEFAANSNLGITPKELLAASWNTWLFETDGTKPLNELVSILSQNPNVTTVSKNNAGTTIRDSVVQSFIDNIRNTVKFDILNNELIFMNSQDNPIIVFTNR